VNDPESDVALIERVVRDDDREAFAQLVRRHQSAIRSVLRRLTRGDHGLADDLAQECFLQAYRSLQGFRGEARFRTWLYRIACNQFLQYRRSAQVRVDFSVDSSGDANEITLEDAQSSDVMRSSDLSIDLARAMDVLSHSEREAIIHCYYADLSHSEAAAALGWPVGTLKTHVLRARQKLRGALSGWNSTGSKEASYG
jgi:RNA polymerase sigma factor (sigma-70 family)